MKGWRTWLGPCALMIGGMVWAAARTPAGAPEAEPSEAARLVARRLPQWHLTQQPMDDARAAAALERFLAFMDFDRSYFLASDVRQFQLAATNLDNRLIAGDVAFAREAYDILRARVSNRVDFVEGLLKQGFELDGDESYTWKRKDAAWPADEKAWDDLWRRKIKNQYIAHMVNRQMADAARTNEPAASIPEEPPVEPSEEVDLPTDLRLTPEEAIRKSYRQYLDVLNDNRAEWPVDRYLTAFAQSYDPHTDYMSASQTEDFEIGMQLSLVGIGARLTSEDGAAKIDQLIPGGPAEKDGRLKAGDKIIAVAQGDGEPVSILHWPLSKAVRLIRGEKNTKVVLSVIPASDPTGTTVVKIDLVREEVKLEDQAAKSAVKEVVGADGRTRKLGIITLPDFYADVRPLRGLGTEARSSAQDVRRLLRELSTNGVEGLVLDLRNNGGGLLAEAVRMTGLFIERGPVVQVSDGRRSQVMNDSDPEVVYDGPMLVLVNRQTASASEILAGALQDYGRAVIAGDSKTHGKGTVQTLADLKDGQPALGKLKVTTASFYRINGGSTQLRGIAPDIVTPSSLDTLEIGEETLPQALPWSQIRSLTYALVTPLREEMPALRSKVEGRRKADARYQAYLELLGRLAERQKDPTVTLNFEKRLELARTEKELSDQLREKDEGSDQQADIMLNEALQILNDLISLNTEPADSESPVTAAAPAG